MTLLSRATVCEMWRCDRRRTLSCGFSMVTTKKAEWMEKAQRCLIFSVTKEDANLYFQVLLFISFLLYIKLDLQK